MASSTQITSTSTPSASSWEYDVFLSFRGKDTRKGFTGHLHKALKGTKSIKVFKDNIRIRRGTKILSELMTAIEKSRFALIVFSPDYASSEWCLNELVKIYDCMQVRDTIIPIFYYVEPSHVRHQSGTFAAAFNKHDNDGVHSTEKVQQWRAALREVANMSGWNLAEYQEETEFITDIVDELYNKLVSCAGCNKRVNDGGHNCLGAVWQQACLLCKGCKGPCADEDYEEYGDHPYHKRCYEAWIIAEPWRRWLRSIIRNQRGIISGLQPAETDLSSTFEDDVERDAGSRRFSDPNDERNAVDEDTAKVLKLASR